MGIAQASLESSHTVTTKLPLLQTSCDVIMFRSAVIAAILFVGLTAAVSELTQILTMGTDELKEVFNKFDANADDLLTLDELNEGSAGKFEEGQRQQIKDLVLGMMPILDTDSNNMISLAEVIALRERILTAQNVANKLNREG